MNKNEFIAAPANEQTNKQTKQPNKVEIEIHEHTDTQAYTYAHSN